jgi:hypothetical protein
MCLTFLRFGFLMDANFRREPPRADGFPTNAASARKGTSPAMAEAVWFDFGSSQCAVPAIFSQFEYPKVGACCA